MRFRGTFVFACVLSAVPAASALARPAMTTYLANMRSGAGPGFPVIASIPERSVVDMGACARTWCRVTWNGMAGYVAAGLLTTRISSPVPAPVPAPSAVPSEDNYRYVYGGWGPYFCDPYFDPYCYNYTYFDWGGGGWYYYDRRRHRWRPHPHQPPRPGPGHTYPRPRPEAGLPGRPPRGMITVPSTGPVRVAPGNYGRGGFPGVIGGPVSGPRGPGGAMGGPGAALAVVPVAGSAEDLAPEPAADAAEVGRAAAA